MHYHIQVNVVACVVDRILDNQTQISLMTIIHASTLLIHIIFVTGRLLLGSSSIKVWTCHQDLCPILPTQGEPLSRRSIWDLLLLFPLVLLF